MTRTQQVYGIPKVHKDWTIQVSLQPVNSQVGSLSALPSRFVDYYLKKLVHYIPGMINESLDVIKRFNQVKFNQPNIWLVSSDDISMYPKIRMLRVLWYVRNISTYLRTHINISF